MHDELPDKGIVIPDKEKEEISVNSWKFSAIGKSNEPKHLH